MRWLGWLLSLTLLAFTGVTILHLDLIFTIKNRWLFLLLLTLPIIFLKRIKRPPSGFLLIVFIYVMWCFATSVWSEVPKLSLSKGIANFIVLFTMLYAGYAWAVNKGVNHAFDCLILVVAASMFAAIFGLFSPYAYDEGGIDMYRGLTVNGNMFGTLMAMSMLWILWRINIDWLKPYKRNLWLTIFMVALIFLWMSHSRASTLVFIFTIIGLVRVVPIQKWILLLCLVVLTTIGIFSIWPRAQGSTVNLAKQVIHKSRTSYIDDVFSSKMPVWKDSWERAKKVGWLGAGYGITVDIDKWQLDWTTVGYGEEKSNSILAMIEEIGVVGLILYILLLFVLGRRLLYAFQVAKDPQTKAILGLTIGFLTGMFVGSQFEAWWVAPGSPEAVIFWAVVGIALGLSRLSILKLSYKRRYDKPTHGYSQ